MKTFTTIQSKFSAIVALAFAVLLSSCSRESLQVQKWDKLDYQASVQQPMQTVASAPVKQQEILPAKSMEVAKVATPEKVSPVKEEPAEKKHTKIARHMAKVAAATAVAIAKKNPVAFASAATAVKGLKKHKTNTALDHNLRLAIIFVLVGIILDIIGAIIPVIGFLFLIIGSILIVVGLIFLILWLLDQA